MYQERRRYERKTSTIRVEMRHPSFGTIIGSTTDVSDGGARVTIENMVAPPVGTEVDVLFKKRVGQINSEPVAMKIMHSSKSTLGLMFVPRN